MPSTATSVQHSTRSLGEPAQFVFAGLPFSWSCSIPVGDLPIPEPLQEGTVTYPWLRLNILPGSLGFEFAAQLADKTRKYSGWCADWPPKRPSGALDA